MRRPYPTWLSWAMPWMLLALPIAAAAQDNRIDAITPMAPELAAHGEAAIGVRTITATDRDRPDIVATVEGGAVARHDRVFTLEIWYPATPRPGAVADGEYRTTSRDPSRAVVLHGRAMRDAAPAPVDGGYPLVIVSHGYPGNRLLLSHLGEHLASKGFVVASIDHPDSTYADQKTFASTLYHRPHDQLFVLDEIDRLSRGTSGSFLAGLVDPSRTAIVGYSMGGYGLLNVVGAGFSDASVTAQGAPPNRLLHERAASNPAYPRRGDPRIKAAIAIAPWGATAHAWDAEAFGAITTPMLFVAGSVDDVAGYEKGTRAIFEAATGADRYLLTYLGAGHNAGAPIPAPAESRDYAPALKLYPYMHYADAAWDTVRMNNILQHFATAFLARYVKGDDGAQAFLDLVPRGSDGVYSVDRDGRPKADHTYWKGFRPRTAAGLVFEHLRPGESASAKVSARAVPVVPAPPSSVVRTASEGDHRDIRRLAMLFESAWASHDIDGIAALWTQDGDMLHPDGAVERGSREIAMNRAAMLADRRYRSSRHPLEITRVTFRGFDVAVVDGRWQLTNLRTASGGEAPSAGGVFTWVVQRDRDGWKIAAWRYTFDATSPAATMR